MSIAAKVEAAHSFSQYDKRRTNEETNKPTFMRMLKKKAKSYIEIAGAVQFN